MLIILQMPLVINLLLWICAKSIIYLYDIQLYRRHIPLKMNTLHSHLMVTVQLPFRTWLVNLCVYKRMNVSIWYSTVSHRKHFLGSLCIVCDWHWTNLSELYCGVILQTNNVGYNAIRNLLAISVLASNKLQIQCLQKAYCIDIRTPFQA